MRSYIAPSHGNPIAITMRFRRPASLEAIRERERRFLAKHGLLDRPWFILASAPDPTIPAGISDRAALICVNNSPATALRLGLRPPELTIRASHKEWTSVAGCSLPLVLLVTNDTPWMHWKRPIRRRIQANVQVSEIETMRKSIRQTIYTHVLHSDLKDIGSKHKPSMGIFAVVYGVFVGIPEIILAGVSVYQDGYSYGTLPGIQIHRDEDRYTMQAIGHRYRSVCTTETAVAEQMGMRLCSSVSETH